MKKLTLNQRIEKLEQELMDLKILIGCLPRQTQPITNITGTLGRGEWCSACGAWKQYGVSDNHYCTGYKVLC